MSPELFIQQLQHPEQLEAKDLQQLEDAMQAYPCFAAAKELYLKYLHQTKDLSYEAALFKTSLASPNRQQLFAYIHAMAAPSAPEEAPVLISQSQAFDLIDNFLGDDAMTESPETPSQALESLEKLYVGYQLEEKSQEASFESPLIQEFMDHPQEEIAVKPEQEVLAVEWPQDDYESAWESLPTDSLTLTLVKIYLKQKKYERALEILRTLSLNNPEKSVYFADQIRFLEKLLTHLNK